MTASPDATTPIDTPAADDVCDACPHSLSSHDRISLRFCQATIATALSRACVCPV